MDLIDDEEIPKHERELTLSTGAILGIFLGLAVLCGGFFGFGYNMGRKSAPTPLNLSDLSPDTGLAPASGAAKPAAGSPLDDSTTAVVAPTPAPKPVHHTPAPTPTAEADNDNEPAPVVTPKPTRTAAPAAVPAPAPAPIVRAPAPVSSSALNPSAGSTSTAGTGTFTVQVAAVSHQEDADLLVGALRARGYSVAARTSPADHFIHVQVGPFHSKQDADAMRQRLLADGYNAIVK